MGPFFHSSDLVVDSICRRAARAAGVPVIRTRRAIDQRSRARRWRDAVAELATLQSQYVAWLEALPSSLQDSATAEALQAICELDLADLAPARVRQRLTRSQVSRMHRHGRCGDRSVAATTRPLSWRVSPSASSTAAGYTVRGFWCGRRRSAGGRRSDRRAAQRCSTCKTGSRYLQWPNEGAPASEPGCRWAVHPISPKDSSQLV